jgi:hypothetical protein
MMEGGELCGCNWILFIFYGEIFRIFVVRFLSFFLVLVVCFLHIWAILILFFYCRLRCSGIPRFARARRCSIFLGSAAVLAAGYFAAPSLDLLFPSWSLLPPVESGLFLLRSIPISLSHRQGPVRFHRSNFLQEQGSAPPPFSATSLCFVSPLAGFGSSSLAMRAQVVHHFPLWSVHAGKCFLRTDRVFHRRFLDLTPLVAWVGFHCHQCAADPILVHWPCPMWTLFLGSSAWIQRARWPCFGPAAVYAHSLDLLSAPDPLADQSRQPLLLIPLAVWVCVGFHVTYWGECSIKCV